VPFVPTSKVVPLLRAAARLPVQRRHSSAAPELAQVRCAALIRGSRPQRLADALRVLFPSRSARAAAMNNMKGLGSALPNQKGGKGKPAAAEEEDDDEEFDPSTLSTAEKAQLAQLVKGGLTGNPELIKALQGRLDGLVGRNSGYIDSLPSKARRGGCAKRRVWRQRAPGERGARPAARGASWRGVRVSARARGGAWRMRARALRWAWRRFGGRP
jgi:hypothetical protein